MISVAPLRPVTPVAAQPEIVADFAISQTLQAGSTVSSKTEEPREDARPKTPTKTEEQEIPPIQQPPRFNETSQMVVDDDDEDEDEDIEMPVIDPASPTDSELE